MTDRFIIGLGAQKAGTTWLWDILSRSQCLRCPPLKELHTLALLFQPTMTADHMKFRTQRIHALARKVQAALRESPGDVPAVAYSHMRHIANLAAVARISSVAEYFEYLRGFSEGGKYPVFEISPTYSLLSAEDHRAIASLAPGTKVLIVLRDPISRFLSQVQYSFGMPRREKDISFDEFAAGALTDPQFTMRSDYERMISAALAAWGDENVLVARYEMLFSRSGEDEFNRICQFIGADDVADVFKANIGKSINTSEKRAFPAGYVAQVARLLERQYAFIERMDPNYRQVLSDKRQSQSVGS